MDAELRGQFGQRPVGFDGGQRHLRLKGRPVIPSRSLHLLALWVRHHSVALVKPGYHLAHCLNFQSPLSLEVVATALDNVLRSDEKQALGNHDELRETFLEVRAYQQFKPNSWARQRMNG
jgi:hypothetical protein